MEHTTYIWQHPDVHYDMVTSGINMIAGKKQLHKKCLEMKVTTKGWTIKHKYTGSPTPDPRDNEGVSGAAWGNYLTHFGYSDE